MKNHLELALYFYIA